MEPVKVIMRFINGRLIKGYTSDFYPNKPFFRVRPADAAPTDAGTEVFVKELKAVFFVKDFAGNPEYNERKDFDGNRQSVGRRMEVTFSDGEVLVGSTMGHDPKRPGFFLYPADPESNALRVFIISAAVSGFRYLK